MDKGDWYQVAPIFLMIFWQQIHRMYLTAQIDSGTANSIAMGILILPMFLLEFIIQHITAQYPYLRSTVRPHNGILRIFIKNHEEIRGEDYSVRRIETAWPVRSKHYGPVNAINIIYEGKWSDRIHYKTGRARHMEYEVNHPNVEQIILYELMEGVLDLDHQEEIPNYLLINASGDYYDEMMLIDYDEEEKIEESKEGETQPEIIEVEEEQEPSQVEAEVEPLVLESNLIIFSENDKANLLRFAEEEKKGEEPQ